MTGSRKASKPSGSRPAEIPSFGAGVPWLDEILACRICKERPLGAALAHEPRPILRVSSTARLVIASQAPGIRAHLSGVPFHDASGARLRDWMGLDEARFYDADRVVIVPMGFCFPGHDANKGDRPPRAECRLAWHDNIFASLPQVETILAIGLFAIRYHVARLMPERGKVAGLTETVADWRSYFERPAPRIMPLPHPSWRNSGWIKQNPWFEAELLPVLRSEVARLVGPSAFSRGSMPPCSISRTGTGAMDESPARTEPDDPDRFPRHGRWSSPG